MKSKNPKIQTNLKKGLALILLFILMFSSLSSFQIVFAAETSGATEESDEGNAYDDESNHEYIESWMTEIEPEWIDSEEIDYNSENIDINAAIEKYGLINYSEFKQNILDNNIILIDSEKALRALSVYVAEGNTTEDKTFELTNNIALTSNEWLPIGSGDTRFKGTFNGRGYTVSNIIINKKQSYAGLFGCVQGATIKNIIIGESNINIDVDIVSPYLNDVKSEDNVNYAYLGAVVGLAKNSTISNCINKTNVIGGQDVGGIVGAATDTNIDNCSNSGTIEGFKGIGGIVGSFYGTDYYKDTGSIEEKNYKIDRCKNSGRIIGIRGNAGGIAGKIYEYSTIKSCVNSGNVLIAETSVPYYLPNGTMVTAATQNAGGIVGWASSAGTIEAAKASGDVFIIRCINEENAEVKGKQDIGGIVGQLGGKTGGIAWAKYCICYSDKIIATEKTSAGKIAGCVGVRVYTKPDSTEDRDLRTVTAIGHIQECYYVISEKDKEDINFYRDSTMYAIKEKGLTDVVRGYGYAMRTRIVNNREIIYNYLDNISNGNNNVNDLDETGDTSKSNHASSSIRKIFKYTADSSQEYGYIKVISKKVGNEYKKEVTIVKDIESTSPICYKKVNDNNATVTPNSIMTNSNKIETKLDFVRTLLSKYECTIGGNSTDGYIVSEDNKKVISSKGKISIDGIGPQKRTASNSFDYVTIKLNGTTVNKPTLAKKDDIVSIAIQLNEKINLGSVKPTLTIASNKKATYVGVDEKTIYYSYVVTGDERVSIGSGMKLSGTRMDIFGNKTTGEETISLNPKKDITIMQKKDNTVSLTSSNGLVGYEVSGFEVGNDGNFYYNSESEITVKAIFNEELTKAAAVDSSKVTLNIKLANNKTVTIEKEFSGRSITFEKDNLDKDNNCKDTENVKISQIYLTTGYNLKWDQGEDDDGQPIEVEAAFSSANTGVSLNNIYLDTVEPGIKRIVAGASYPKNNNKYVVGEEILINVTTTELINTAESIVPTLNVKFGNNDGKFNNGTALYLGAVKDTYKEGSKEIEAYTCKYRYVIQPGDEGIFGLTYQGKLVDIAGNEKPLNIDQPITTESIIADTTAPIVTISAKKVAGETKTDILNGITNANTIEYTFTWSEEVVGFTSDSITVNGGTKGTLSSAVANDNGTYSYTMNVTSNVESGNVGEVQVIVEQDRCLDIVGQGNVRSENILTVDKDGPTLKSYNVSINEQKTEITVETIFDEAIASVVSGNNLSIKVGGRNRAGTLENPVVSGDKVTYVYKVSGADGGNIDITLIGKVKDIAGNESEELNVKIDNNIVLEKHVIESDGVEYSFSKKCSDESAFRSITDFSVPTYFKAGDTIKVTVGGTTSYEYTIEVGDNGYMKKMTVTPAQGETPASVSFSTNPGSINISAANIYFDTTAPSVDLSANVEEPVENNIYSKGKEIIIVVKTNEEITNKEAIPEINVSFSESGLGKYNYQTQSGKGNAKYVETIVNEDNSISWKYKYVVTEGDEGEISLDYANSITILDLAGNSNTLVGAPGKSNTSINVSYLEKKEISGKDTKVSYEFYKGNNKITDFSNNTYYKNDETIKVVVKFTNALYKDFDTGVTTQTAPQLKLDGKVFTAASVNNNKKEITYTYTVNNDSNEKLEKLELIFNTKLRAILSNGNEDLEGKITGNNGLDISNANLYIYNNGTDVDVNDIKVDTTVPTVIINAEKVETDSEGNVDKTEILNNVTNADKIEYTFTWNEEVIGFTAEDITVNGGEIAVNADGTPKFSKEGYSNEYTLEVIPATSTEKVQVIIEKNACQDVVGYENVRSESVIRIDKIAPKLECLEAYATSNINVDFVDPVKEYYNAGEVVTVVATFSENIENSEIPVLNLKFSESGNAKGTVVATEIKENKITYTYTVTAGDTGRLTVKGFTGEVIDAAGNVTKVTNRALDGDTIIADTTAPTLKGFTVIAQDFEYDELLQNVEIKRYGETSKTRENNTIIIIAEYSENVYNLNLNSNEIYTIAKETAPVLTLKFGTENAKGTVEFAGVEGNKLYYTYDITDGDNGNIDIVSLVGQVSDIAGNTYDTNANNPSFEEYEDTTKLEEEKHITADTEEPTITLEVTEAIDKYSDGNIITENTEGDKSYYRDGSVITFTVTSNEYIYNNDGELSLIDKAIANAKKPTITFGEVASKGEFDDEKTTVVYDEKNAKTTITYTYIVKGRDSETGEDGDNGSISLDFAADQYTDIALNNNASGTKTEDTIIADTIDPYIVANTNGIASWDIKTVNGVITAIGTFSEELYVMNDSYELSRLTAENAPIMGVFGDGNLEGTAVASITTEGNQTVLTYTYDTGIEGQEIDAEDVTVNIINGTLYDIAGNMWSLNVGADMASPRFEKIQVLTEPGYYKSGEKLEIIVKFREVTGLATVPTLKIKIGESNPITPSVTIKADDELNTPTTKVARYEYTIADENGPLNIISLIGDVKDTVNPSNSRYIEKYYVSAPEGKTLASASEILALNGSEIYTNNENANVIVDTTKPVVESVEVKAGEKYNTAKYVRETAEFATGRTNSDTVEYIVTFSEPIRIVDTSKMRLLNGEIIPNDYDEDDYYESFSIITKPTIEGVQSLLLDAGLVEDRAGNNNDDFRFNGLTTDFTSPIVSIISEYNGGVYVLPTNVDKIDIRPNVEIKEEIAEIKYKWINTDDDKEWEDVQYEEVKKYTSISDIALGTQTFGAGTYKLYIKVVDLAGNIYETPQDKGIEYKIVKSNITITPSTYSDTNETVLVTVEYGAGLTDNKKVLFRADGDTLLEELSINENEKYEVEDNGIIYVEATDKVGNKVYNGLVIDNIDREEPTIDIELNSANLVIGTDEETAIIKTKVTAIDNMTSSVDVKYLFSTSDETPVESLITNSLNNGEAIITNATRGTYYLHVLATDAAGNKEIEKAGPFTIFSTKESTITVEGEEQTVPADKTVDDIIIFVEDTEEDVQDRAYVNVDYDYSIVRDSAIRLEESKSTYGFIDGNHIELYGKAKIIVEAYDVCGNKVENEYEVEDIITPTLAIFDNPENWTKENVTLDIYSNSELKNVTVNDQVVELEDAYSAKKEITQYGEYTVKVTDIYDNLSTEQKVVVKIDKSAPTIEDVDIVDGKIVITANDIDETLDREDRELSGIAGYAITDTTEVPLEWSKSNVINVTKDANFFVWVKDNAGNITEPQEEIVVRDITAPELTITTDIKLNTWTNTDINVSVKANEELKSLVIKYKETVEQDGQTTEVEKEEDILETKTYTITSNGSYEIIGTDKSGNTTKEAIAVSKIDKDLPEISEIKSVGKEITITATDAGSEVKEYAITNTTEEPVEWSKSKVIKVTEDGIFYAWVKDNAGNIRRKEEVVIVDTTAPAITFSYLSQTITVGMPVEANIVTNENATISYSWDKENWVNSETLISSLTVSKKSTTPGKYTLYVKATDGAGNESGIQVLEFTVSNIEEIKQPDIIFEDIPTIQVNGAKYVKVSSKATIETLTDSMNKEALCGKTPEYKNLTEDDKLKTGSEIAINGKTKYIIIVNGDVNCDGKITFLGDVVMANNYRIGQIGLKTIQKLAADINNNGVIEFIPDIVAINNYRLGIINSL